MPQRVGSSMHSENRIHTYHVETYLDSEKVNLGHVSLLNRSWLSNPLQLHFRCMYLVGTKGRKSMIVGF